MNTINNSESRMKECLSRILRQNIEFFRWIFYSLVFSSMGCLEILLNPNSMWNICFGVICYFLGLGCILYVMRLNDLWLKENMKWIADNYKEGSE